MKCVISFYFFVEKVRILYKIFDFYKNENKNERKVLSVLFYFVYLQTKGNVIFLLINLVVMAKYNISEPKDKEAAYRTLVNPRLMDELKEKILTVIVMQKKYKDKNYSAKQLAEDLGTNTRYISAVVNVRFHMNYTSFVNKYRIEEAMSILVDKRYRDLRIEEVSDMVGFANRQSFYASFYKLIGITPKEYRLQHFQPAKKK